MFFWSFDRLTAFLMKVEDRCREGRGIRQRGGGVEVSGRAKGKHKSCLTDLL